MMRWIIAGLFMVAGGVLLVTLIATLIDPASMTSGTQGHVEILAWGLITVAMALVCFGASVSVVFPERRLSPVAGLLGALVASGLTFMGISDGFGHGGRLIWVFALVTLSMAVGAVAYSGLWRAIQGTKRDEEAG
jgi:hypothetical protein